MEKNNRTRRITIRLNDQEIEFLDRFSKSVGISRSEVIRNLVKKVQGDVKVIQLDKLLNSLDATSAEQGRVNNNINQLAKHANQYFKAMNINSTLFEKFNILFSKHLDYQNEINKLFRKIYKSIS